MANYDNQIETLRQKLIEQDAKLTEQDAKLTEQGQKLTEQDTKNEILRRQWTEQVAENETLRQQLVDQSEDTIEEASSLISSPHPPPAAKKRKFEKDVEKLKAGDLSPSAVTWNVLKTQNIVQDFDIFCYEAEQRKANLTKIKPQCSSKDVEMYKHCFDLAKRRVRALNEGFSMVCCGIMLLHIVDHLHTTDQDEYTLMIYPVVKMFEDKRKNKRFDYILMRLVNRRCIIVFELKLSVGTIISGCEDSLAQLFLEVKYAVEKDKDPYSKMVCVLADHENWHILMIRLRCPFEVLQYYFLHDPDIDVLCSLIKTLATDIDH